MFWQLDPVRRIRARGHECEENSAWVSEVLREWGSCGRVLYVDDQPAGHLLYAPAVYVRGASRLRDRTRVSPDAVLLVAGHVDPSYRGGGLGRVLVQAMAKDLVKRGGIRAVEAFGEVPGRSRRQRRGFESPSCVLPADYLLGVGFRTHRPHARYPRMRMDLRPVLTWRGELEAAFDRCSWSPVRHAARRVRRRRRAGAPHAGLRLSHVPADGGTQLAERSTPVWASASGRGRSAGSRPRPPRRGRRGTPGRASRAASPALVR